MAKTKSKGTGSREAEGFDFAKFEGQAKRARGFRRGFVEAEKKILEDGDNLFRLVGNSDDILVGWVMCADGKRRPIRLKDGSILQELYDEVTREEKRGEKKGDDGKMRANWVPVHEEQKFYKTVSDWRIRREFLWNCIDRDDDWCARNKHTKLLAASKYGEGFGPMIFQGRKVKGEATGGIVKLIKEWGDPTGYDIKVEKAGQKMDTSYVVMRPNPARTKGVVNGPLTAEEKKYGRYDLTEIARPTTPERIIEWLGGTIKAVDKALGTTYLARIAAEGKQQERDDLPEPEVKRAKLG